MNVGLKIDVPGVESGLGFFDDVATQFGEVERPLLIEVGFSFQFGELNEVSNQGFTSVGFPANIVEKAVPLFGGHVFFHQFDCSLDGREWTFKFVGQGRDVVFDVAPTFQGFFHIVESFTKGVDLPAFAEVGDGQPLALGDRLGILGQAANRPEKPDEHRAGEQDNAPTNEEGGGKNVISSFSDEGQNIGLGFINGDHSDDVAG